MDSEKEREVKGSSRSKRSPSFERAKRAPQRIDSELISLEAAMRALVKGVFFPYSLPFFFRSRLMTLKAREREKKGLELAVPS